MFQVSVLASGSKGNCLVINSAKTAIILDAGISAKRIFAALQRLGIDQHKISAIFVSHEHSDHTSSVGALSRLLKIPIYITLTTFNHSLKRLGDVKGRERFFETGDYIEIADLIVHPFKSSHDAVDSCNFVVSQIDNETAKLGVATDLGYSTQLTNLKLSGCTSLILESNHDETMLITGPYEWHLKQRVKSILGHLSNEQAVGIVSQIHHPELRNLILAHLSETNNRPELAYQVMRAYLNTIRSDVKLIVASPYTETPLINI